MDLIGETAAGKTFYGFWRLLTDIEQSTIFSESLSDVPRAKRKPRRRLVATKDESARGGAAINVDSCESRIVKSCRAAGTCCACDQKLSVQQLDQCGVDVLAAS